MSLSTQLSTYAKQIEDELKRIIKKNAYDTGALHNATFVTYKQFPDAPPEFQINTLNYFEFLDEGTRYITAKNMTDKLQNSSKFAGIMEEIGKLYVQELVNKKLLK